MFFDGSNLLLAYKTVVLIFLPLGTLVLTWHFFIDSLLDFMSNNNLLRQKEDSKMMDILKDEIANLEAKQLYVLFQSVTFTFMLIISLSFALLL